MGSEMPLKTDNCLLYTRTWFLTSSGRTIRRTKTWMQAWCRRVRNILKSSRQSSKVWGPATTTTIDNSWTPTNRYSWRTQSNRPQIPRKGCRNRFLVVASGTRVSRSKSRWSWDSSRTRRPPPLLLKTMTLPVKDSSLSKKLKLITLVIIK